MQIWEKEASDRGTAGAKARKTRVSLKKPHRRLRVSEIQRARGDEGLVAWGVLRYIVIDRAGKRLSFK